MDKQNEGAAAIDAYIATFPEATQRILEELRATIRADAPDAQERIAYGMPTFSLSRTPKILRNKRGESKVEE